MNLNKHKGTEFSNVKEVWEQNAHAPEDANKIEPGTKFSNIKETWEENEKKKDDAELKNHEEKPTLGEDYWDRVADDVASGYTSKEDEDEILNVDQLPDDHERGDE